MEKLKHCDVCWEIIYPKEKYEDFSDDLGYGECFKCYLCMVVDIKDFLKKIEEFFENEKESQLFKEHFEIKKLLEEKELLIKKETEEEMLNDLKKHFEETKKEWLERLKEYEDYLQSNEGKNFLALKELENGN